MPPVIRSTRGDRNPGLSIPATVGVSVASLVVVLTLGTLLWVFIVRRRNKDTAPTPAPAKSHPSPTTTYPPRKPESTHLADSEKARERADQVCSPEPPPPPSYSPVSMNSSSTSDKKSTLALNVDIDREADESTTLPSPLRSASFNPSTKTQSIGSRISSRISTDAKKLPRLMIVAALYIPSLSDELPIRLGETIRMIEEYEDEWCLVQRVGRTDERGVVPRFCLNERQEVIPRTGQRISSGLFRTSTFRK